MNNMSRITKLVLVLIAVMIGSFLIAGILFFSEYHDRSEYQNRESASFGNGIRINLGFSGENGFSGLLGPEKTIDEEKTADTAGIGRITINTTSSDINVIPSDGTEVKAHFYGKYKTSNESYKPELVLTKAGDTVSIKIEHKSVTGPISFSGDLKLDIYMPKTYAGALDVGSTSGNISSGEMRLESFNCNVTSGDVKIRKLDAKNAKIESTSGNVEIGGTYDKFTFKSTSGDFTTSCIISKDSELTTTSGNIRFGLSGESLVIRSTSGDLISDALNVKSTGAFTTSGKIQLKGVPGNLDAGSVSGDIYAEYYSFGNNINLKTTSGSTRLKLPSDSEFKLSYKTVSGSSICDFPITIIGAQQRKGLEGTVVSDKNRISVVTTSGDLNIIK